MTELWTVRKKRRGPWYIADFNDGQYYFAFSETAWRMTRARAAQCVLDLPDLELVIERAR